MTGYPTVLSKRNSESHLLFLGLIDKLARDTSSPRAVALGAISLHNKCNIGCCSNIDMPLHPLYSPSGSLLRWSDGRNPATPSSFSPSFQSYSQARENRRERWHSRLRCFSSVPRLISNREYAGTRPRKTRP